jgi:hypothetical protein
VTLNIFLMIKASSRGALQKATVILCSKKKAPLPGPVLR